MSKITERRAFLMHHALAGYRTAALQLTAQQKEAPVGDATGAS